MLVSCLRLQEIQFRDALALHVGASSASSRTVSRSKASWTRSIPWELQLKYRLDDSTTVGHECHVRLNTLDVPYGFNYADPSNAVVMTPSSLRYLFALSACIRNAQAAMLAGPSEVEKATLAVQVSSILGRRAFCIVVAPSTQYSHVVRLLAGALYSGGTFCVQFPYVTDCAAAILKVLGTQLAAIERAVLTGSLISGVHRAPIAFTPGTAFLVTCTATSSHSLYSVNDVRVWSESMGQFEVVAADYELVLEALLCVNGFADPGGLSKKLLLVHNQARSICVLHATAAGAERLDNRNVLSMRMLKAVIHDVARRMKRSEEEFERPNLQRYLLRKVMLNYVRDVAGDEETYNAVAAIVTAVFQNEAHQQEWFVKQFEREEEERQSERRATLTKWLYTACDQCHFAPRPQLINNALTLSSHMNTSIGTILAGACGTGKTTAYHVLAKAIDAEYQSHQEHLQILQQQHQGGSQDVDARASPSVQTNRRATSAMLPNSGRSRTTRNTAVEADAAVFVRVVLPGALTLTQLYGSAFTESRKDAASSVLGRLVHEAQNIYSSTVHVNRRAYARSPTDSDAPQKLWVVFDRTIETPWIETLMLVLKSQRRSDANGMRSMASELFLPFENGEFMTVPPNLRFLFESLSLAAASPSVVASNAILHFKSESEGDMAPSGALHSVFLHRFFTLQRKQLSANHSLGAEITRVFDTIERRLLDTCLLDRLQTVIEKYAPAVRMTCLQRVQGFVSLLQAVLHSIVSMPTEDDTRVLVSTLLDEDGQAQDVLSLRIAMGLAYSLLWGFAACISDSSQLMLLVSSTVKSVAPEAAPAWSSSGREVNLFETIADFAGMRFVHVNEALVGAATKVRGVSLDNPLYTDAGQKSNALGSLSTQQPSFLFVPTRSSLLTHAAMKDALRTGRTVLLVGDEDSRRTTLLRSFMQQMASVSALLAQVNNTSGPSSSSTSSGNNDTGSDKGTTSEEKTLESVNRIRFHQISLVMVLAARFCRESDQGAMPNGSENRLSTASLPASQYSTATSGASAPFDPTWTPRMTAAVQKLDSNSVIPFFFGMTQHDHGALELAGCMERMLHRERAGVFEPPPGKAAILLIDDLHLQTPDHPDEADRSKHVTQTSNYPSCYEFLRSASEHSTVYTKDTGAAATVENLFMIASTSLRGFLGNRPNTRGDLSPCGHSDAFVKLAQRCFPVLTPSCSSTELCSIFSASLATRMDRSAGDVATRLATTVKQELPGIVAATVVLWERLRDLNLRTGRESSRSLGPALFNLHDLARVFDAIGSVDALAVEDSETLLRLWTHECVRTFQDQFLGIEGNEECYPITSEIALARDMLRQVKQLASRPQATEASARTEDLPGAESLDKDALRKGPLRAGALHQLMQVALTPSTSKAQATTSPNKKSSARLSRVSEASTRRSNPAGASVLWAFVPEVVYFDRRPTSFQGGRDASSKSLARRSSRMLLRRASHEIGSLVQPKRPTAGWVYAELVDDETASRDAVDSVVQKYFNWVAASSSGFSGPEQPPVSARWSLLPLDPNLPYVSLSLVH